MEYVIKKADSKYTAFVCNNLYIYSEPLNYLKTNLPTFESPTKKPRIKEIKEEILPRLILVILNNALFMQLKLVGNDIKYDSIF